MIKHQGKGRAAHNRTPQGVYNALVAVVDRFTRADPTKASLHTTSAEYPGVAGLLRVMESEAPAAAGTLSPSGLRGVLVRLLEERGLVGGICSADPDHNVCELCKVKSFHMSHI